MSKFKEGDTVKVIMVVNAYSGLTVGDVHTVNYVEPFGGSSLKVVGSCINWTVDQFKLVSCGDAEVSEEEEENRTPHKHAEFIHACADGAEIEYLWGGVWKLVTTPSWVPSSIYRIVPSKAMLKKEALLKLSDFDILLLGLEGLQREVNEVLRGEK